MPSRLNWSTEEEKTLKFLKEIEQLTSWKKVAEILNEKFPDTSRSGKQCRDRYINYVRFNENCPKIEGWTPEEDKILFSNFKIFGAKWVQISTRMPGRSENNLKNRFYGAMRKIMRKMAKVQRLFKPKFRKNIKQKHLIQFFQECRSEERTSKKVIEGAADQENTEELYQQLLYLAVSQQQKITQNQIIRVVELIHQRLSFQSQLLLKKRSTREEEESEKSATAPEPESIAHCFNMRSFKEADEHHERPLHCQEDYPFEKDSSLFSWGYSFFAEKDLEGYWMNEDQVAQMIEQSLLKNDFGSIYNID